MEIFLISFVIIILAVTGMAIGVLLGGPGKRIQGSCGGIAGLPGMEGGCACGREASSVGQPCRGGGPRERPKTGGNRRAGRRRAMPLAPPGRKSDGRRAALPWLPWVLLVVMPWSDAPALEAPRVVASIPPVHSLVAGVMEGVGSPSLIVRGYGSPHAYRMRPSDAVKLHGADLVFRIGDTLEGFLRKPLSSLPKSIRVVSLLETDGLTLLKNREGGLWQHDHDRVASRGDPEDNRAGQTDPGTTFPAHLDDNPHIWLDPENAKRLVKAIARHLAETDPAHAARYGTNASALSERIDGLAKRLEKRLSGLQAVPYLVFHDAYPYLEARYGLQPAGSVTANPNTMPSARRIADLRSIVERLNIRCIFREPQFGARWIEAALDGTDVTIGVLDPLGGGLRPGPDLWFRMMADHAEVMTDCLSGARSGMIGTRPNPVTEHPVHRPRSIRIRCVVSRSGRPLIGYGPAPRRPVGPGAQS